MEPLTELYVTAATIYPIYDFNCAEYLTGGYPDIIRLLLT
jgi:hypothetical protein